MGVSGYKMNERDSEELSQLLKNPEFLELDKQLYLLHSRLLFNHIKAVYIPDDGRSIPGVDGRLIAFNPGWEASRFKHFISEFHKEAERIAWQMAKFFPKTRRFDWKERFIGFAVLGDYEAIPTRDIFFITHYLLDTEKKNLILLADRYENDKTAKAILNFFNEATNDPDNELVHLCDIWEALNTEFGGEKIACDKLNISRRQKKQLTRLANDEPVRQGRHRGKHADVLRDATTEELEIARKIAANMIYSYLKSLEQLSNTTSTI